MAIEETGSNSARLFVANGTTTLYDNSVFIQTTELHGGNYSWEVLEGGLYNVSATTVSTMTGFSTYALQITSASILFAVELIDTTTGIRVFYVASLASTALAFWYFNVLTNANTVTANITNNSAGTLSVVVNGGAPFNILAGATSVRTGLPKAGITIVAT